MKYVILYIIFLPLFTIAQSPFPVRWETKAVQTDHDIFEIHMICTIDDGWYLFEPNRLDVCMRSPLIDFDTSSSWRALTDIDVLSYKKKDTIRRGSFKGVDRECLIPYYQGAVTFIMAVKKLTPEWEFAWVKGRINYQATSKFSIDTPVEVEFSLPLKSQKVANNVAITRKHTRKVRFKTKRVKVFCPGFPHRDSTKPL